MQSGDEVSIEELASNLSTYKEQLQQVRQLLHDEPDNSEYIDMEKELAESKYYRTGSEACGDCKILELATFKVIALTEELLVTAKQSEDGMGTGTSADASHSFHHSENSDVELGSILDHADKFPVGTKVQAVYSEDGEWYDATIHAHTPNGYYVCYDEWGNKEEVDHANIRPLEEASVNPLVEAEKIAEATKQALKRKIAQAASSDIQSRSLPAKLLIDPNDPEDVKAAKKKKIHAFKSKVRIEQLEVAQNKRQNAWQQFQSTKGQTKKVGFFSGRKRESIFKSPEDPHGKVGVTGSGKGLTDFQKREKHLHLKGANSEASDE
uniref:Tudor domain-containing protein n=1 Tax=Solanum lycopersicum TaxID=4081 RepID=A0A3Q7ER66_SOLLC